MRAQPSSGSHRHRAYGTGTVIARMAHHYCGHGEELEACKQCRGDRYPRGRLIDLDELLRRIQTDRL